MYNAKCSCKNCFVFILIGVILGIGLTAISFFSPVLSIAGTLIVTIFSGAALLFLGVLAAIACSSDCSAMKIALMQNGKCTAIAATIALIFGIIIIIIPFYGVTIILLFITITAFLVLLMSFTSIIITTIKYFECIREC